MWFVKAQLKHCKLNIIDQLLSWSKIKYANSLVALELSHQCFILMSTQALHQTFVSTRDNVADLGAHTVGLNIAYIARAENAFPPSYPPHAFPFSSKALQNRWHHHLVFFQLVRLDLLMKGSLYVLLPMQTCSCTFSNHFQATVRNCPAPAVRAVSLTAWRTSSALFTFSSHKVVWCFFP